MIHAGTIFIAVSMILQVFIKQDNMDFLPKNYNVPKDVGNYMRWGIGANAFRILGSAITGWEYWTGQEGTKDRKPVRKHTIEEVSLNDTSAEGVKHFWAFPVWNYQEKRVQILEVKQKGIIKSLKALIDDEENWGSPLEYDVVVTREGEGMDTEYQVNPRPPKKLDPDIAKKFKETFINLEALFSGDDPFIIEGTENVDPKDIPF